MLEKGSSVEWEMPSAHPEQNNRAVAFHVAWKREAMMRKIVKILSWERILPKSTPKS